MVPNPKIRAAFCAMKGLGISETKVKRVLKGLLKLYDNEWELIEEGNYRALADAIFEEDETKASDQKKKPRARGADEAREEEAQEHEEPERPLKRLRLRGQEGPSSVANGRPGVGGPSLTRPRVEKDELHGHSPQTAAKNVRDEPQHLEFRHYTRNRRKQPVSHIPLLALPSNEPAVEPNIILRPKQKVPTTHALVKPKNEPYTDDMPNFEVPIAVIHPGKLIENGSLGENIVSAGVHGREPSPSECADERNRGDGGLALSSETRANCELAAVAGESPHSIEIGSSSTGEVKISLSCNSGLRSNMDAIMKLVEEKCLRSYRIVDPKFSLTNLLNDICNNIFELGTHSNHESREEQENALSALDQGKKPASQDALHSGDHMETLCISPVISCGYPEILFSDDTIAQNISRLSPARNCLDDNVPRSHVNGCSENYKGNSQSLVVVPQCELSASDIRSLYDKEDITKGEENVNISWVNEINKEFPPPFQYIPRNIVFDRARVSFTLHQIGDKNCCRTCIGDCLASSTPCSCADETGSEYAYTSEGNIKQCFLHECVTLNCNPQKHHFSYCKECPVEKSKKGDEIEPCKGHLRRKFIKECWVKCGCNKQQCGNRVVRRGINCKLQVFMTPDGKGWGLRTLEELPQGAFVCEYVGEILTNAELYERNKQNTKERSYPVLLDAGWGSGVVEDEKALCLDSTLSGNVSRFINHRCLDANLVEIPVEVETPDHSYYHVALFTTRKVDAMEELTRDYGIDFDDQDHPVRPFRCLCGSKFCRNMKRTKRSRSASIAR